MDITFESSEKLYNDLVKLVQTNEAFYTTEQELDGVQYIIFNYRMASYTDFCQAGALNARGTMFEVYNGNFIRLVCLPFAKFFNLGETPFTMDLDLSDVDYIADKMDGSMICSYLHTDKLSGEKILKLKTKGSISSDQAIAAMRLIETSNFLALKQFTDHFTRHNNIVIFEYVAPDNRIVLNYNEPDLKILAMRRLDGHYVSFNSLRQWVKLFNVEKYLVKDYTEEARAIGFETYINAVPDSQKSAEGIVVRLNSGIMFKQKQLNYVALHKIKDNINSPRNLYEAIVAGGSDDLRSLFKTDQACLDRIKLFEDHVFKIYNNLVKTVEEQYAANKDLDRKSFAIKMKATVPDHVFSLLMSKYIGREVDYRAFMIKHWDDYKLLDVSVIVEE